MLKYLRRINGVWESEYSVPRDELIDDKLAKDSLEGKYDN